MAAAAVWLVSSGSLTVPNVVAAVVGAVPVAAAAATLRSAMPRRLRWRVPLRAGRVMVQVLSDNLVLIRLLGRRVFRGPDARGSTSAVPLPPGCRDPSGAGRRAVLAATLTLTPNTLVLGVDREEDVMVVHSLQSRPMGPLSSSDRWSP